MTYRTIVVDLSTGQPVDARLGVARALAARFGAALVALHVTPPLEVAGWQDGMSAYLPPEFVEARRRADQEIRNGLRAAFERVCGGDPNAIWREAEGYQGWTLVRPAHAADLVVAPRDDAFEIVEQVVTATGVPVPMVPPGPPPPAGFGPRVAVVAWKSSREAARAVRDALPLLRTAERVVLCAVGEADARDLEDVAAMLVRHGVVVRAERVAGAEAGARAGEILLERAAAHEADLLVMGFYGHSRLRELVLGGATRRVLRGATLPVLLSN